MIFQTVTKHMQIAIATISLLPRPQSVGPRWMPANHQVDNNIAMASLIPQFS